MNKLLKDRGIGDLLNIIAFAAGIVGLICYLVSAEDKSGMTETFVSAMVYVPLIIALVINVAAVFVRNSLVKIGAFAVYFFAFAAWCYTQGGYIVCIYGHRRQRVQLCLYTYGDLPSGVRGSVRGCGGFYRKEEKERGSRIKT